MDTSPRSSTPPAALAPASAAAQAPTPIDAASPDVGPAHPGDNRQPVTLMVNGRTARLQVDPAMPLVFALRDHLGLTGTKYSCLEGACGTCTVHLNGQAIRSCVTPISAAEGQQISTIEAQAADRVGKAVEDAWVRHDVAQCGYCQSGQIMSAAALLKANRTPTDADIDGAMAGNICRCGTYARIRTAIHDAARSLAS